MAATIDGTTGLTAPSGAIFNGIASGTAVASTSGTSSLQIQIGAGSVITTGYVSGTAYNSVQTTATSGYLVAAGFTAVEVISGTIVLTLLGSNNWTVTGTNTVSGGVTRLCAGVGSSGGTLDRIRITTVNGTDTFDAGSVNILYE